MRAGVTVGAQRSDGTITPHGTQDGDSLGPLFRFAIATAAVGLCLMGLWREWDRRNALGFSTGQKSASVVRAAPATPAAPRAAPPAAIDVYFSRDGGATNAIVRELGRARQRVRVQAYRFTSAPIAKALVDAKRRGVGVTVILDSSQQTDRYSSATFLHNARVLVYIDDEHAIAHNKVILSDADTVITGSFNFSKAAEERNAENILVLRGRPDVAQEYQANFEKHLAHAKPYRR